MTEPKKRLPGRPSEYGEPMAERVTLRMPTRLLAWIEDEAKRQGVTRNRFVVDVLRIVAGHAEEMGG